MGSKYSTVSEKRLRNGDYWVGHLLKGGSPCEGGHYLKGDFEIIGSFLFQARGDGTFIRKFRPLMKPADRGEAVATTILQSFPYFVLFLNKYGLLQYLLPQIFFRSSG